MRVTGNGKQKKTGVTDSYSSLNVTVHLSVDIGILLEHSTFEQAIP